MKHRREFLSVHDEWLVILVWMKKERTTLVGGERLLARLVLSDIVEILPRVAKFRIPFFAVRLETIQMFRVELLHTADDTWNIRPSKEFVVGDIHRPHADVERELGEPSLD